MTIGKLFVYGTLRPNKGDSITLKGYKMFDLGWYPGVVYTGNMDDSVTGELVPVHDEKHLSQLDSYEGCRGNTPNCLYHRKNILSGQDHLEPAWIYTYNGSHEDGQAVTSGDWLDYKNQESGSNAQLLEGV